MIETYEAYEKALLKPGLKVMVFMSDWCMDCHYMLSYLEHIRNLYHPIPFHLVNREKLDLIRKELNIFGVPSLIVYQGDIVTAKYVDKERKTFMQVKHFMDQVLSRKDD